MNTTIKKIIFICEFPLDKRIFKILGIDILLSRGYLVEFWDVTPYFHKFFFHRITKEGDIDFEGYKQFNTKQNIINAMSLISADTVVILHITLQMDTFFIFHHLSNSNIKYCVLQMIFLPNTSIPKQSFSWNFFKSLVKRFFSLKPMHALVGLCNIFLFRYHYFLNVRPADLAILSGEKSLDVIRDPINENTHLIWSHSEDYDTYLSERQNIVSINPKLGVFLDEYYPLHTDLDYLGISAPIGAEEYFSKLCSFFDYLEKTYNVRIMIAAHPRSNYTGSPDYFGGRTMVKGHTAQLVHKSAFVIAHDSTSINFAVLFKKPIIFITMDKMQKCDAGRLTTALSIKSMSNALKKKPVNLDSLNEFNWNQELTIDLQAYENYINDIIHKKGVPDIPSGEIFVQRIKEIYG